MKLNTNNNYIKYTSLESTQNIVIDSIEYDEGCLKTSKGLLIPNSTDLAIGDYVVIINGVATKLLHKTREAKKRIINLQEAAFK